MPAAIAPDDRRPWTWALLAALGALLVAFQFADIAWAPLQAWDESRLAVNAIEMMMTGQRFVTTYGFTPDLWNTKPPLAINLMAWSMQIFGPTAWAARLPAALAACATVGLVTMFVRRVTGSLGCGLGAGALLAAAPVFYGFHSGQTADYDAILTLFTTGYAIMLFDLIERDRTSPWHAAAAGGVVGLAILTKGIAGVIPGVGIAAFAILFALPSLQRKAVDYAIVIGVTGLIGGGFYLLRGMGAGGYLAAVAANELGGRFGTALDEHRGDRWFYLREIVTRAPGRAWPALVALLVLERGPARRLAIFALCQIAGIVIIYSSAATKISWYLVPALPFTAIALALAGLAVTRLATRHAPPVVAVVAQLVMLGIVLAFAVQAVRNRYLNPPVPPTAPRSFDQLIAAAASRHMLPLVVIDTGFVNGAGFADYAPTLRFYSLAARLHGIRVVQASTIASVGNASFAGTCDPAIRDLAAAGRIAWQEAGCALLAR